MAVGNQKRTESRIKRLQREIAEINEFLYDSDKHQDRSSYMFMLERKRDDIVRSAVFQLHTQIEDLMTQMILSGVLGAKYRRSRRRTKRGLAFDQLFANLGFDAKLNLAVVVGIMNVKTRDRLKELNRIRNKCGHNWRLNVPVIPRKKSNAPRLRLLSYGGHDLHQTEVLKRFIGEFTGVYLRLFLKT